jgi:Family of unknown function (DUF7002)
MGVTPEELARVYPLLYHMAEADSWPSIREKGLLSTSALLVVFEVSEDRRIELEARRRPESVEITHERHGRAVIRDQKPLIESKLTRCLEGCSPEEWYRLLNGRVFFWLTKKRLNTLLCANSYAGAKHTVLTVDTLSLVNANQNRITLAGMNTGNTRPFAHPRGPDTFKRMHDYPFQERAKYGLNGRVVELAVEGGVPDIARHILSVDEMNCTEGESRVLGNILRR